MAEPTMRPLLSPAEIAVKAEEAGVSKATLPLSRMFVLAVLAGAFIALGGSFMLVVRADGSIPYAASQVLGGFVFCLGLFLVFVAGAELFTGNCLMAVGALSKRYGWSRGIRNWVVVYAGNAFGAIAVAGLMIACDAASAGAGSFGDAAYSVALTKSSLAPEIAFARGIMCNILVCLAVWMGFAGQSIFDKLAAALLPVMAFVALGFEHSIANLFFLPYGYLVQITGAAALSSAGPMLTVAGIAGNLLFVTLGNIVGGVLIASLYWFVYRRNNAKFAL